LRSPMRARIADVSPPERVGWHEVDTTFAELRRHFRTATTAQDYEAVGQDRVRITEP